MTSAQSLCPSNMQVGSTADLAGAGDQSGQHARSLQLGPSEQHPATSSMPAGGAIEPPTAAVDTWLQEEAGSPSAAGPQDTKQLIKQQKQQLKKQRRKARKEAESLPSQQQPAEQQQQQHSQGPATAVTKPSKGQSTGNQQATQSDMKLEEPEADASSGSSGSSQSFAEASASGVSHTAEIASASLASASNFELRDTEVASGSWTQVGHKGKPVPVQQATGSTHSATGTYQSGKQRLQSENLPHPTLQTQQQQQAFQVEPFHGQHFPPAIRPPKQSITTAWRPWAAASSSNEASFWGSGPSSSSPMQRPEAEPYQPLPALTPAVQHNSQPALAVPAAVPPHAAQQENAAAGGDVYAQFPFLAPDALQAKGVSISLGELVTVTAAQVKRRCERCSTHQLLKCCYSIGRLQAVNASLWQCVPRYHAYLPAWCVCM